MTDIIILSIAVIGTLLFSGHTVVTENNREFSNYLRDVYGWP